MNIVINAFVIILILIVTLCTATVKPKMHKHFILTSQNFKLTNDKHPLKVPLRVVYFGKIK